MSDVFPASHWLLKLFAENIWDQISIKKCKKSKRKLWGILHVEKKIPILITTAILSFHTMLPFARWRCNFYLKNTPVQINTNRFVLTQPRVVRFWGLSLLYQPRFLPTAWLFPAALEHQTNRVFWFFQINFFRTFLLTEIVIGSLVLFWLWTEFFKLPECREEDFPSLPLIFKRTCSHLFILSLVSLLFCCILIVCFFPLHPPSNYDLN